MRVLSILLVAALAGCATVPGAENRYQRELDQLERECRARGGILVPIPRAVSGNPAADYACEFRGGAPIRR